jgi:hypothetical protein
MESVVGPSDGFVGRAVGPADEAGSRGIRAAFRRVVWRSLALISAHSAHFCKGHGGARVFYLYLATLPALPPYTKSFSHEDDRELTFLLHVTNYVKAFLASKATYQPVPYRCGAYQCRTAPYGYSMC